MKKLLVFLIIFNSLNFIAQNPIYNKDSTVKVNLFGGSPSIGVSSFIHDFNALNQELSNNQAPELNDIGFGFSLQQTFFSLENLEKDKQWVLSHSFNWQNTTQDNDSIQTGLNYYQYYWSLNYNLLPASKEVNLYIGLGLGGSFYNLSISDITDLNNFESVLETFNSSNISKRNGIAQLNIACQTKFISLGLAYTFNAINGKWKQFENKINDGPDMGLGVFQLKVINVF